VRLHSIHKFPDPDSDTESNDDGLDVAVGRSLSRNGKTVSIRLNVSRVENVKEAGRLQGGRVGRRLLLSTVDRDGGVLAGAGAAVCNSVAGGPDGDTFAVSH